MKWIMQSPGSYRLVDDSDERPAVKLPSKKPGSPNLRYTPSWKKYEEGMKHQDSKNQVESGDKFMDAREHAMRTDPQAKKWEESRKATLVREKPQWIKEHPND
jgi:hypothetical protein